MVDTSFILVITTIRTNVHLLYSKQSASFRVTKTSALLHSMILVLDLIFNLMYNVIFSLHSCLVLHTLNIFPLYTIPVIIYTSVNIKIKIHTHVFVSFFSNTIIINVINLNQILFTLTTRKLIHFSSFLSETSLLFLFIFLGFHDNVYITATSWIQNQTLINSLLIHFFVHF